MIFYFLIAASWVMLVYLIVVGYHIEHGFKYRRYLIDRIYRAGNEDWRKESQVLRDIEDYRKLAWWPWKDYKEPYRGTLLEKYEDGYK